jgi:hypothetical protein
MFFCTSFCTIESITANKTKTPDPRSPNYAIYEFFIHIPIHLFWVESFFFFLSRKFLFVLRQEFLVENLIHILEEIVSYLDDFSFWAKERMCSDPYRTYPEIFLTMEIPPEEFLKY